MGLNYTFKTYLGFKILTQAIYQVNKMKIPNKP